jgi:hypothetical protein
MSPVNFILLQQEHNQIFLYSSRFPMLFVSSIVTRNKGRAIAQAVSRWLPTVAARMQTRV